MWPARSSSSAAGCLEEINGGQGDRSHFFLIHPTAPETDLVNKQTVRNTWKVLWCRKIQDWGSSDPNCLPYRESISRTSKCWPQEYIGILVCLLGSQRSWQVKGVICILLGALVKTRPSRIKMHMLPARFLKMGSQRKWYSHSVLPWRSGTGTILSPGVCLFRAEQIPPHQTERHMKVSNLENLTLL